MRLLNNAFDLQTGDCGPAECFTCYAGYTLEPVNGVTGYCRPGEGRQWIRCTGMATADAFTRYL